jgi:hypothetical protein
MPAAFVNRAKKGACHQASQLNYFKNNGIIFSGAI